MTKELNTGVVITTDKNGVIKGVTSPYYKEDNIAKSNGKRNIFLNFFK